MFQSIGARLSFVFVISVALMAGGPLRAADDDLLLFDPVAAVALSQSKVGGKLTDFSFTDQNGQTGQLSDYRGKPMVIALFYTACAQSCPLLVETLADAADTSWEGFGRESFSVLVIGFDPKGDTPERLKAYALTHGLTAENWRFASAEPEALARLIAELGYLRVASPRGFDHVAQSSLLDAEGRISAHIYGTSFDASALADPLKALLFDEAGKKFDLNSIVERVRLFCTFYDPKSGRYAFDYSFFISVTIATIVLALIALVLVNAMRRHWLDSGRTG